MGSDGTNGTDTVPAQDRPRSGFLSGSLTAKFAATVAPIFLAVFLICIAAETWHSFEKSRAEIKQRLGTLAASQSIILAESIAKRETGQLSLMLASIISEPNLIGIAVYDTSGAVMDSFGTTETDEMDLITSIPVNYSEGAEVTRVGTLTLVMTDRYVREELGMQVIEHTLLGIVLLVATLAASLYAHRRAVGQPLGKLVSAITESRGNALEKVDWQSDDEIGHLIRSFNDMQERLAGYERELVAAQEQLEQRVEERTHDLEQARESAVEADRVKSKFLSSMSHEFRTPMNAILGFTQVLQMSPELAGNPRLQDRLAKIEDSSQSLMALLDQIMDFAQIEGGDDEIHLEPVEPAAVIREAVELVAPLAESRHVSIYVDEDPPANAGIRADTFKLRKALFHLLSNAIKYNRPGGRVDIALARSNGQVCIAVADTGEGIPADRFQDIFEPFNRLGREAGNIDGSGIGLTVTQRIIERMSGEIDFDSVEGEGSTFRIWFPAAA